MTKLYLLEEEAETTYWTQTSTYGDDIEIIYDITDEQLAEWKRYLNDEIEEPDWVHDLDFDLVRDKTGSDDYELELIEDV